MLPVLKGPEVPVPSVRLSTAELMIGVLVLLFGSSGMARFGSLVEWGYIVTLTLGDIVASQKQIAHPLVHSRAEHLNMIEKPGHIEPRR